MKIQEQTIKVRHHVIHAVLYTPLTSPIGCVQILHGLAEHSGRYDALINALVSAGYQVVRHDHVTHGQSRTAQESLGDWRFKDQWKDLITDSIVVYESLADTTLPYIILGHSMGSIIARELAATTPHPVYKLVLLGSLPRIHAQDIVPAIGMGWVVSLVTLNRPSNALYQLIARNTKAAYGHPKGWLTTDELLIHALDLDPDYGFIYRAKFYLDFFRSIRRVNQPKWIRRLPAVPILFMTGDDDPAGRYGQGVQDLVDHMRKLHPVLAITLKRYPGMRHELHNEVEKHKVFDDLYQFLTEKKDS
jgi:alpha-beta hydrolase superfamily lysophospholipase